jgi:hypothetical protein
MLTRLFQSGNINFLIGSGASCPAIQMAGLIEKEVEELFRSGKEDEARQNLFKFVYETQICNDLVINSEIESKLPKESSKDYQFRLKAAKDTLTHYEKFIDIIGALLAERKTSLLPKQANIFTTNYDLFIEKASEAFSEVLLNDGFSRSPNLNGECRFSSRNFFNSIFNNGNLYSYRVEIPCINLLKIHGSFSWRKADDRILFKSERSQPITENDKTAKAKFVDDLALILPKNDKYRDTILDRTYYDLLRLYANQLDKESSLLIAFGFSFVDKHILEITLRALKNPTLQLIVFAYTEGEVPKFETSFAGHRNVTIVSPQENSTNDFAKFNHALASVLSYSDMLEVK